MRHPRLQMDCPGRKPSVLVRKRPAARLRDVAWAWSPPQTSAVALASRLGLIDRKAGGLPAKSTGLFKARRKP